MLFYKHLLLLTDLDKPRNGAIKEIATEFNVTTKTVFRILKCQRSVLFEVKSVPVFVWETTNKEKKKPNESILNWLREVPFCKKRTIRSLSIALN